MSSYFVSKSKDTSWATWVGTNKCHLRAHVNLQVRASFILRCGCKEHTLWNTSSPLHKLHWREIGSHISESSARMPKVFLSPSSWCQYYAHCLPGHTILCYSRELACGSRTIYYISLQHSFRSEELYYGRLFWNRADDAIQAILSQSNRSMPVQTNGDLSNLRILYMC